MGNDVLKMLRTMNIEDMETQFAIQCAPLVAGLKISNLFIIPECQLADLYQMLKGTSLSFYTLCISAKRASVLVYDPLRLNAYLRIRKVRESMKRFGYDDLSLAAVLPALRKKYRRYTFEGMEFPHELGLVLGYPAEDVEGFLRNHGENSLYTGYWKVYYDLPTKLRLFESFDKAQEKIIRLVFEGNTIKDIICKGA